MYVNQQFFLSKNLRGELCKSGMHLAIRGVRWEAERADGGVVGHHTGRLAEETGSFSGIALACRSWRDKATSLFMQSEGYRESGSFRGAHAGFSPLLPHPPFSLAGLESAWKCGVAPPPSHLGESQSAATEMPPINPPYHSACLCTPPVQLSLPSWLLWWLDLVQDAQPVSSTAAAAQPVWIALAQPVWTALAKQTELRSKEPVFQGCYLALSGLPLG